MSLLNFSTVLSILSLVVIGMGVVVTRIGRIKLGLMVFSLGCLTSVFTLAVFVAGWAMSGALPQPVIALLPIFLCLIPAVSTVKMLATRHRYPRIHDITTDTENPPVFLNASKQRNARDNDLEIQPDTIRQQVKAYPDLSSVMSRLSPDAAFAQAQKVAESLGWKKYSVDTDKLILEAVDTTRLMGFKDDIVVRVQASENGSRVDLRSASRRGQGDIGTNAKRIRRFIQKFQSV